MLMTNPYRTILADQSAGRPPIFIPTVYEKEKQQAPLWEYHVLSIDTREMALPDPEQLNTLGQAGWILVGILDERASGRGAVVYYYFTRQVMD